MRLEPLRCKPLLGPPYEIFLRPITYYRIDSQAMYLRGRHHAGSPSFRRTSRATHASHRSLRLGKIHVALQSHPPDEFLSRKPIRYMVSQADNRIDFAEVLDQGRILLVRLAQGLIGRENTSLLGSLITAKLQMAAMSRQRMPAAERRDFWRDMDEFQHFITSSRAEILAGARKYRLGLILAHQDLRQLDNSFRIHSERTATNQQTAKPTNTTTAEASTQEEPLYIRLRKPGQRCARTGMTRSALNELILPTEKSSYQPPVESKCLRKREGGKGTASSFERA